MLPLAFETPKPGSLLGFLLLVSTPSQEALSPELAQLPYVGEGPGLGWGGAGSAEEKEEISVNAAFPNILVSGSLYIVNKQGKT